MLKRTWDYPPTLLPNSIANSTTTKQETTNSLKHTNRNWLNCWQRILHLGMKSEMFNKISDYLLILLLS
jgi:hypothetical protein